MSETTLPFAAFCVAAGLPAPLAEYRFARPRRFAFDWAWPDRGIALEVEGAVFGRGPKCPACGRRRVGGHSSIERIKTDMEKYNLAALRGWRVLRCTAEEFNRGDAVALVRRAFEGDEAAPPAPKRAAYLE